MTVRLFIVLFLFAPSKLIAGPAENPKKSSHREHKAHVHGGGSLAVAFDGASGKLEFKSSAIGLVPAMMASNIALKDGLSVRS